MGDKNFQVGITVRAFTPSISPEEALRILGQIAEYEEADDFPTFIADVEEKSPEDARHAGVIFGDSPPEAQNIEDAEPNIFVATYDGEQVTVDLKAEVDKIESYLNLLEHVLGATELRVGVDISESDSLNAVFRTRTKVDTDKVDRPDDWLFASFDEEDGHLMHMKPFQKDISMTLDSKDSMKPVREAVDEILDVAEQVSTVVEQAESEMPEPPELSSPTAPVEALYAVQEEVDLENQEAVSMYLGFFAHSRGVYVHADDVSPEQGTSLSGIGTEITKRGLDESEVDDWVAAHEGLSIFVEPDDVSAIAQVDNAVVEATISLDTEGGGNEQQASEHLVALEDGDWKIVR